MSSGFWICGPFMEAEQRQELNKFKLKQQEKLESLLDEMRIVNDTIQSGSEEEKLLAEMLSEQYESQLKILLGIDNDNGQTKSDEIS